MSDRATHQQTDQQLRDAVLREIEWQPAVCAKDICVAVEDGAVTLTGRVESSSERHAAERATKSVYGVRSFENEIEIAPKVKRDDAEIVRDVQQAFTILEVIPEDRIKVRVQDGIVRLEGSVDWYYQKSSAATAARMISGIRGVVNDIRVQPAVSPTLVKEGIESALGRSAKLNAHDIRVVARGNEVELQGFVRTWLEREEAGAGRLGCAWGERGNEPYRGISVALSAHC